MIQRYLFSFLNFLRFKNNLVNRISFPPPLPPPVRPHYPTFGKIPTGPIHETKNLDEDIILVLLRSGSILPGDIVQEGVPKRDL